MAATFRASTNATVLLNTNHSGNKPTGTADGDALLAGFVCQDTVTVTAPSGWGLEYASTAFNGRKLHVYSKRAASEGASWTWTTSAASASVLQIAAVQGNDQTVLVDSGAGQANASSVNVVSGTVSPSADNGCLIGFFAIGNNATFTPATGMTEQHDQSINSDRAMECAYQNYGSPGGSVQKTATASAAQANAAWIGYIPDVIVPKGNPLFFGTT